MCAQSSPAPSFRGAKRKVNDAPMAWLYFSTNEVSDCVAHGVCSSLQLPNDELCPVEVLGPGPGLRVGRGGAGPQSPVTQIGQS